MADLQRFRLVPDRRGLSLRQRAQLAVRSFWAGPFVSSSHEHWWATNSQTSSGLTVNEWTALNQSMVWKCVNRISGDVASLPLMLFKRLPDGGKAKMPNHPLYALLHDQPNPEMTSMVWRQTMQAHALTWGNGYSEIVRNQAGRPIALWPLVPDRVQPFRANAQAPLQYRVSNGNGQAELFDAQDILHVHGLGYNGVAGYSVIGQARESLGLSQAAERFGATMFGNGLAFGGVLEHPGKLTEQAKKNLKESLASQHQGVDRAHRWMIAEEGMKVAKTTIPPDDAQFLETRQFQREEVEHWFNIPRSQTRANIEDETIEYYTTTLMPWLALWEEELTVKLVAPLERTIQLIEHSLDGKLRGDTAARGEFYMKRFSTGSITPNKILELENEAPIVGGDRAFVPLNLIPLDKVDAWWDAQIEAKKPAPPAKDLGPSPLDAAMNRIAELTQEVRDARLAGAEANAVKLEVAQREADGLRVELTETRTKLTAADQAATELRATVATQTTEIAELGTALEAARSAVVRETAKAEEAEARAALLSEGLATATANGQELMQKWAASESRNAGIEAERDGLVAEREQIIADRNHSVQRHAALETELAEARVVATELREQVKGATDTREALGKADAEKQAALTAKATAEAEKQEAVAEVLALQDRVTETAQAMRAVLVDRFQCVINRETDRARKAQQSPEKLAKWIETFYPMHEDFCREALRPALRAWLVSQGRDDADRVLSDLVVAQLGESRQQLRRVIDETRDADDLAPILERVLRRWETERADAMVDRVMRGER